VRYGREIKYRGDNVQTDYARWRKSAPVIPNAHRIAWVVGACLLVLGLTFALRPVVDVPLEEHASTSPRERIGVRVPGKSDELAADQLLARLPFEPRVPEVAAGAPRMLPASAMQQEGWQTTPIRSGDNLSRLLGRMGVNARDSQQLLSAANKSGVLRRIMAGRTLAYRVRNGELHELAYEVDRFKTLLVKKHGDEFKSELVTLESDVKLASASGEITRSLFLDGQAAGLSDRLIMEFTELFGWDVDFVLEMRRGDRFKVIYEEMYRDGEKISNGRILGAEFTNQGKQYRAIFFKGPDGSEGYYTDKGQSMRKAFLRAPLNFTRISSRFNLARRHPILNRIRAHRGVDYSAPMGTPIRAVADGKIEFAGVQNGYGNVVILKHGDKYSTLYGHMMKFAKNIGRGKSVSQGQLIGYVGKSGLATGPHLHYEFRINGTHHDPLKVKLPRALSVEPSFLAEFKQQTRQTLALLEAVDENSDDEGLVANAGRPAGGENARRGM